MMNRLRRGSGTAKGKTPAPLVNSQSTRTTVNHLSASEYASRCKRFLELRADIYNLDMGQEIEFDFPRLVVIGDQSSGKSSLVEAVSGINVPRDSGTCTRCPMECIMRSTNDSWSCSITLQREAGIVHFGPKIYDKSSVELWIRRAQAAVLSPHRDPTEFLGKTELELKNDVDPERAQFSGRSIRVEIMDPESPDLDFVDLPGIVHAVEPPTLEKEVMDLVKSFIEPENTVILIVMPMTNDMATQSALQLAKDADPSGDRTIGILTKPDGLQDGDTGSREAWMKILANGKESDRRTKHGYYCVRLPNDQERKGGATREKALNIAEGFFNTRTPWNRMADKSRCGIPNFVKDVSVLLVELIEKYLPALAEKVAHLLSVCLIDIANLPPILDKTPSTEILLRVSAFCQAFKDGVFGRDNKHFVQGNKRRYSRFCQAIRSTKPTYEVSSEPRLANTQAVLSPVSPVHVRTVKGPHLSLADVREVKESTITWELPPHVPFDATVKLVDMYTSMWESPSLECFDDIVLNSIKFEKTLLDTHFGHYGELLKFVHQLTSKERDKCRDEARRTLRKILEFESKPLYTQNTEFLDSERTKWLREHGYWFHRSDDTETVAYYHRYRYYEKNYQEIELMADSYAYFQVSHKRIIDYVPLAIEHELNQSFVNNIEILLFSKVTEEAATPGRLEALVQEDYEVGLRRQTLAKRKAKLLKIKQKLDDFLSFSNVISPNYSPGSNERPSSSRRSSIYHSTSE